MHRDDVIRKDGSTDRRWVMDAGDRAGDALAAFTQHEQVRREAMIARACQGGRAPGPRSLVAWVLQLRSAAEPAGDAPGPGWGRGKRRQLQTLIDRLRVVAFPGPGAPV